MSIVFNPITVEQVLQRHTDDKIIAHPGEPIVNVDAIAARRKVSGYIGREVSSMMGGMDPGLVYSEGRLIWRVPIIFTTPSQGQLGIVGVLDVDARTGELLIPSNLQEALQANAHAILENSPHSSEN